MRGIKMKKRISLLLVAVLLIVGAFSGCESDFEKSHRVSREAISAASGLTLPDDYEMRSSITRDEFWNDDAVLTGRAILKGEDRENVEKQILDAGWNPLPLTEEMHALIYEGIPDIKNSGDMKFYEYIELPEIENGWWRYVDRSEEDGRKLISKSVYNFDMAIYDSDSGELYTFRVDA